MFSGDHAPDPLKELLNFIQAYTLEFSLSGFTLDKKFEEITSKTKKKGGGEMAWPRKKKNESTGEK